MRKVLIIAMREFLETVKTKTFLISLLVAPLLWVAIMFISGKAEKMSRATPQMERRLTVIDLTGEIAQPLRDAFAKRNQKNPGHKVWVTEIPAKGHEVDSATSAARSEIAARKLDALLVLPRGTIEGNEQPSLYSKASNIGDFAFVEQVERMLNSVISARRGARHNLSPDVVEQLTQQVSVKQVSVAGEAGRSGMMTRMMIPFVFMMLLYMGILSASGQMLTSVIEEKNSRVVEVLLSSVSPTQFMAGKVLGLAAVGLLTIALWGAFGYGAAVQKGITGVLSGPIVFYFIVYFVLGFLLFASLFAAVGAGCNTIKEAQSVMMPINIILVLPFIGWFYFSSNPMAFWSRALSFIPPMTPMLMILRMSSSPDLPSWEVAASLVTLALSVALAIWASAKVFRTGILMYGKAPTLREMLRWVRYK